MLYVYDIFMATLNSSHETTYTVARLYFFSAAKSGSK